MKTRVIYNNESLYVGPTPATGQHFTSGNSGVNLITGLYRVQDLSYGFNIARTDVYQFGELNRIDSIILEQPTVNLSFSYLQANLYNEKALGFNVISSGVSPTLVSAFTKFLNGTQDEKNYFIKIAGQGLDTVDANTNTSADTSLAIGNGFISSYSTQGAVGDFPRSSISIEGLNMKFETGVAGNQSPAVDPTNGNPVTTWNYNLPVALESPTTLSGISVLRPGDIQVTVDYNDGGVDTSDWKIQSYNINYNISREPLLKLGSKYAFSKEIRYPLTATASITANVGDQKTGSLTNLINTNTNYNVTVDLREPGTTVTRAWYKLAGCKLDSQEFSESIGPGKSVTLNFSTSIGQNQSTIGCFISGNAGI